MLQLQLGLFCFGPDRPHRLLRHHRPRSRCPFAGSRGGDATSTNIPHIVLRRTVILAHANAVVYGQALTERLDGAERRRDSAEAELMAAVAEFNDAMEVLAGLSPAGVWLVVAGSGWFGRPPSAACSAGERMTAASPQQFCTLHLRCYPG